VDSRAIFCIPLPFTTIEFTRLPRWNRASSQSSECEVYLSFTLLNMTVPVHKIQSWFTTYVRRDWLQMLRMDTVLTSLLHVLVSSSIERVAGKFRVFLNRILVWILTVFELRLQMAPKVSINDVVASLNVVRAVVRSVEALYYKPESRGFDSRWCHWNISLT